MMKVGLLGAGLMANVHAGMYGKMPDVQVTALAAFQSVELPKIQEKHPQIVPYTDLNAFFNSGIQVVDICLPTFLHKEFIEKSLAHHLDVITEKPLCRTLQEVDELLELNQKSDANIYVAQVLRFFPEYIYLRNTIKSNRFGPLKSLYMGRYTGLPGWSINNWLVKPELSGGTPLDLQIHDIDVILFILGEPQKVTVKMRQNRLHIWTRYDYAPDTIVMMEGGNDMPPSFGFEMQYQAVFEKGLIRYNNNQNPPLIEFDEKEKRVVNLNESDAARLDKHVPAGDAYFVELRHFIDCIQQKRPSEIVPLESAASTVRMILNNLPE